MFCFILSNLFHLYNPVSITFTFSINQWIKWKIKRLIFIDWIYHYLIGLTHTRMLCISLLITDQKAISKKPWGLQSTNMKARSRITFPFFLIWRTLVKHCRITHAWTVTDKCSGAPLASLRRSLFFTFHGKNWLINSYISKWIPGSKFSDDITWLEMVHQSYWDKRRDLSISIHEKCLTIRCFHINFVRLCVSEHKETIKQKGGGN